MPSAMGSISGQNGQFTATFQVDGSVYTLSGHVSALEPFNSRQAILEYNFDEELQGSKDFAGNIGDTVAFSFGDGTKIIGPVEEGIVGPGSQVGGSGTWSQN
ncbi:hypothetical protein IL306_013828 [Fusarium sp. DS 682]|nr:hypothetical protein IL306_013828 [Fusarium sp. DS 682]